MEKDAKLYIAGHEGMVGSALLKELRQQNYCNLITKPFSALDLRNQTAVNKFFIKQKPEYVFLIAGKVGGIQANIKFPGEYLYDNLMISANVIEAARVNNTHKLLFLGSSCIYPKLSQQPMREEYLLTGPLESTNEGYAIGKIAGLKLCEYYKKQYKCNFISAMAPNLFGPGDNFSLEHSHVISALIQKIHTAKINNVNNVKMWGTGKVRREFLLSEDLVDGLIFLMQKYNGRKHINIGTGSDISIKELAYLIKDIIDYNGDFVWDTSKPDGMPQKLMDSSNSIKMGWKNKHNLREGLEKTYSWYQKQTSKTT